jgi:hypothetical protein
MAGRRRTRERPRSPSAEDVFALLMDMGTGKSKVILDEWGERVELDELDDLLVIAPAGCYRNWFEDRGPDEPSELRKHLAPALYKRMVWAHWKSGMNAAAKRQLKAVLECDDRPRALFVNVEALSTVKKAIAACREFMKRRCLMAVDESTKIKNYRAACTKSCLELGKLATSRRIMTGLITPRSPMDLYSQFEFLDWRILGHRSYFSYRARYAIMKELEVGGQKHGRNPRIIVGYRNLEELQHKIAPYSYRVLKEDCLDLPPKIYLPLRDVSLTPLQSRMYDELVEFCTAKLEEETYVTATMVLTQRIRLDQLLCGIATDEEGVVHEIPENRTDALLELIEEYGGKVVIWTTHDLCIRRIAARLRKEYGDDSVAQFWGGNAKTRGDDERRFKTDKRCRFMVSTPATGGMGNTWTMAGLTVFYNNSDDLQHRLQGEDRVHRDGLMGPLGAGRALYGDLASPGTIDIRKIKNLRKKIDMATVISGERPREWLI